MKNGGWNFRWIRERKKCLVLFYVKENVGVSKKMDLWEEESRIAERDVARKNDWRKR